MKAATAMRWMVVGLAVLVLAPAARAHWDEGDGHKMHFPQMPDPNGWDIDMQEYHLADDFLCTRTGPITDVHFWHSWADEAVGEIEMVHVSLYKNVLASDNPDGDWSVPGDLIDQFSLNPGEFTVREWREQGPQGWIWPAELPQQFSDKGNHFRIFQVNITDIDRPEFRQEAGEIYWLGLRANTTSLMGWKTSIDRFEDDAVWIRDLPTDPPYFQPLIDPITGESLDLAFVITPEPATLALLGLGAVGLAARRRRRRAT